MRDRRYSHILRALLEQPWALLPAAMEILVEVIVRGAAGVKLSAEERQARIDAAKRLPPSPSSSQPGAIAVLPLFGIISPRAEMVEDVSNPGTTADAYGAVFEQVMADPNIGAVVLQVDSPGGSVYGIEELGNTIFRLRDQKPVVAVVDTGMAASAAYWIASQATELVASPSSQVGSIGVIAAHDDVSKAAEMEGIARTYITAPEGGFKDEGHPFAPLSDEARKHYQEQVDGYYSTFVDAVARGRGISAKTVRSEEWGKGRMAAAGRALEERMVDRVETLQQTISRLAARQGRGGARATAMEREIAAAALSLAELA